MTEREFWEEVKRIAREHPMEVIMAQQHPRPAGYSLLLHGTPTFGKAALSVIIVDYPGVLR